MERLTASGRSSVIKGGRDAIQIHTSPSFPSNTNTTAQYISIAALILIFLCLAIQIHVTMEISNSAAEERKIIEHIYEMRQRERAEKDLERAIKMNLQKPSSPMIFPIP